jgi:peroxiredoxin
MKKLQLGLMGLILAASAALAALEAGDTAPNFEAKASLDGKAFDFSLRQALDEGLVVVYFYPSAFTNGCNIQAHEFAVNMDKFNAAGASVIGVSLDSIERLNDFSADPEYCAGKLAVASDETGAIARSYDVAVREARPGKLDTRGEDRRNHWRRVPDGKCPEVARSRAALPITGFERVRALPAWLNKSQLQRQCSGQRPVVVEPRALETHHLPRVSLTLHRQRGR